MSRLLGWIGFFFFAISGFLPLLAVGIPITKVSILAPITLLAETIFGSDILHEIWVRLPILLYIVFFTTTFYILGLILGLHGLTVGKKQGTRYGGLFGLVYSITSFISAYGYLRTFGGVSVAAMSGAGAGVFSAFIGSVIMLYSARKRGRK